MEYMGERDDKGLMTGEGTLKLESGIVYTGTFKDGYPNGFGTVQFPTGAKYTGSFREGKMEGGGGVYEEEEGCTYEGDFNVNKFDGQGRIRFSDGSNGIPPYHGVFEAGKLIRPQ